jgi:hypothetical protein
MLLSSLHASVALSGIANAYCVLATTWRFFLHIISYLLNPREQTAQATGAHRVLSWSNCNQTCAQQDFLIVVTIIFTAGHTIFGTQKVLSCSCPGTIISESVCCIFSLANLNLYYLYALRRNAASSWKLAGTNSCSIAWLT